MAKVTKAREYVITIPNKVGTLASLLRVLADSKINIVALSGEGKGRQGKIRIVPSDAAKTAQTLRRAGIANEKSDILLVQLSDKPGTGANLTERLAEAGVNIKAGYAGAIGGKALLALNVDKTAIALRVLKKL